MNIIISQRYTNDDIDNNIINVTIITIMSVLIYICTYH